MEKGKIVLGAGGFASEEWNSEQGRQLNGSPEFYKLLTEVARVHDKKSHDYASNNNPSGNYHFAGWLASLFEHSPEDIGFVGRIGEKIYRLANLEKNGKVPKNEPIEDTEVDIATIVVLWMGDRRNRRMKKEAKKIGEEINYRVGQYSKKSSEKEYIEKQIITDKGPGTITEYSGTKLPEVFHHTCSLQGNTDCDACTARRMVNTLKDNSGGQTRIR